MARVGGTEEDGVGGLRRYDSVKVMGGYFVDRITWRRPLFATLSQLLNADPYSRSDLSSSNHFILLVIIVS